MTTPNGQVNRTHYRVLYGDADPMGVVYYGHYLRLFERGRAEFIRELHARGIGTSVHFIPIPLHPAFQRLAADPRNACPAALSLYERIVTLPLYPAMGEEAVERVAAAVADVVRRFRRMG